MAHLHASLAPDQEGRGRPRIEHLLARYPALSEREMDELVHWFKREASALDVALLASNEGISGGYSRFKAEHIERFGFKDAVRAVVFVAIFGAAMLGVIWLAP